MPLKLPSVVALVVGLVVALSAQPEQQRFDVASIKRQADTGGVRARPVRPVVRKGTFIVGDASAGDLISLAYGLDQRQIIGGPDWMWADQFEVNARAPATAESLAQMRPMLRALVEDRFKLVSAMSTQAMPHSELKLARADGRLGPNLYPLEKCGPDSFRLAKFPPDSAQKYVCGPVKALTADLTNTVGQLVVDRTELEGEFAFVMFWPSPKSTGTSDSLSPLLAALQDQLGLKLESSRDPLDVLIVKSLQPPTEN